MEWNNGALRIQYVRASVQSSTAHSALPVVTEAKNGNSCTDAAVNSRQTDRAHTYIDRYYPAANPNDACVPFDDTNAAVYRYYI